MVQSELRAHQGWLSMPRGLLNWLITCLSGFQNKAPELSSHQSAPQAVLLYKPFPRSIPALEKHSHGYPSSSRVQDVYHSAMCDNDEEHLPKCPTGEWWNELWKVHSRECLAPVLKNDADNYKSKCSYRVPSAMYMLTHWTFTQPYRWVYRIVWLSVEL